MKIPEKAVNNPVTTLMVFLAILLFGVVSIQMLPQDILPDIEYPAVTVITVYPGASAMEVEQQITNPLEDMLAGVSNMKELNSTSKENVSFITLEFDWNTGLTDASNDVRDYLELVKDDLPDDASSPQIIKVNSSMLPVLIYSVEAGESYTALDKIISDRISNRLSRIQGVGSIVVLGQPEREIKIQLDPLKLQAYRVSPMQIATLVESENTSIPGGSIETGRYDLSIRVPGEFDDLDELESMVITAVGDRIVHLKDIAQVTDGFKDKDEVMRSFGHRSAVIMVQKQSAANTLRVAEAVRTEVETLQGLLPADVRLREVLNSSELVTHSIQNLTTTIYYAAVFVIVVVALFLRRIRNSLIVVLTIPFSLIVAFVVMYALDYTINIFSMIALAIAIGMVVDNAIVVLENITRHIEQGERPREAAIFGTSEMGMAISASTLTTISVFLPLVFMGGLVGILFKQLAVITSVTLLASLLTALSLTPMLSSQWLKPEREKHRSQNRLRAWSESVFNRVDRLYHSSLKWALHHRVLVILLALVLFGATLMSTRFIGTDYIPQFDAGDVAASIELQVGSRVEETDRVARKIESILREEIPEFRSIYTIAGQTEEGLLSLTGFREGKNIATVGVKLELPGDRDYTAGEMANRVRNRLKEIPEIVNYRVTGGSFLGSALLGNVKPVDLVVMGNDFETLNQTAETIREALSTVPGLVDLQTTVDPGKPELHVDIDREKAQHMGLNTSLIALAVRQSIYGIEASEFNDNADEYQMMVRYDPDHRKHLKDLNQIMVTSVTGNQIPLSAVAEIKQSSGPLEITHTSQQRAVHVTAELGDISLGEATERVRSRLDKLDLPSNVIVKASGQYTEQQESFSSLKLLFVIGLILVFMVMASQFESLRQPFIIIFAIPLSIIGIIWAFLITGETLSVVTFLGVIMLLGIVVNNAIVLVDYTNLLRGRGRRVLDAVLESGHSRLRPVLMTAFTTILAMLPLALSTGMGSEMWRPLGITMIGGLLVSTLITLVLIPVIYTSMHYRVVRQEQQS
jgi:HAE1 family hydrophobic/amphiphilic exporter-1